MENTMKHVIEYLTGYPFLIRTKNMFFKRNLVNLKIILECWNKLALMDIYILYLCQW